MDCLRATAFPLQRPALLSSSDTSTTHSSHTSWTQRLVCARLAYRVGALSPSLPLFPPHPPHTLAAHPFPTASPHKLGNPPAGVRTVDLPRQRVPLRPCRRQLRRQRGRLGFCLAGARAFVRRAALHVTAA
eukprot:174844-Chlamydomonas_euryale.AAC.2